jgi:hypothetical protein
LREKSWKSGARNDQNLGLSDSAFSLLGTKQRDRFTVSCTPTGEQLLLTGDYSQKLDMQRDSIRTDGQSGSNASGLADCYR